VVVVLSGGSALTHDASAGIPRMNSGAFEVTLSGPGSLVLGGTGVYQAVVSGGTPPYTYHWNEPGPTANASSSSSLTFTPTTDQIYDLNVSVTDTVANSSAGAYLFVSVAGPSPVTVALHAQSLGSTTVRITADPTGGVAPYRFAWSGPGLIGRWGTNASETFGNLSAGSYRISVVAQDSRGFNGTNELTLVINNQTAAGVSPYLWVGLGLAAGLVATLAVIILRRRRTLSRAVA
jgi:hypothetical protein